MAKRKISTLLKIIDGSSISTDPLLITNLQNKGGNIIRIGISVSVDAKISMSLNADTGTPEFELFNNGDDLIAGADYVFESVATGNDVINFKSNTLPISLRKLIVENYTER